MEKLVLNYKYSLQRDKSDMQRIMPYERKEINVCISQVIKSNLVLDRCIVSV